MKRTILFAAAFAVALASCDQSEDDFGTMGNAQFMEYTSDGNSYFDQRALETNFTTSVDDLTEAEIEGLMQMREEEKMARDVYLKFYERWGSNVFQNIAKSEESHTNAVLTLLNHFGLTDPASSEVGAFTNPDIQDLYDELVAAGSESILKAFETGAFIEEYDILDLEKLLEENTSTDIQLVYANLLKGSRNHLRAFVTQINNYGEEYAPFLLSDDYFSEIINSEMENMSGNAGWGYKYAGGNGQSGMSYLDCVNAGTGGISYNGNGGNGQGDGTAVCNNDDQ